MIIAGADGANVWLPRRRWFERAFGLLKEYLKKEYLKEGDG